MDDGAPPRADAPPTTTVAGDSALQSLALESLTSAVNYQAWICELIRPYLGDDPLEIGSGIGDYAATWVEGGQPHITVSDAEPSRETVLLDRFAGDPRVTVRALDVFAPYDGSHSSLVATNVLEHLEDHVGALRGAHRLLRPGGKVAIFVPAFPFAMSEFDRKIGHFRRYRRATLRSAFEGAGLRVDSIRYVNAPGLFAWFVGMRLLRMTPKDGPTVRLWDRLVVPVARRVERRVRPPFGQSLLAIGSVPG